MFPSYINIILLRKKFICAFDNSFLELFENRRANDVEENGSVVTKVVSTQDQESHRLNVLRFQ